MRHYHTYIIALLLLITTFSAGFTQVSPTIVDSIPMRDSKQLAVDIYLPNLTDSFPTILIQTPYSRLFYRLNLPLGIDTPLSSVNYAIVIVDWRCFFGSIMACIPFPNRGEDGYDVVQWIASQPWSDGAIGTWGPSALGKVQYQTARETPPNLICCVPQVAGSQFDYLEFYPGGAAITERIEQMDVLGFGVSTSIYSNPVYNSFWQFVEPAAMYPGDIEVPMLMIGGWYDHNTDLMIELFDSLRSVSHITIRDKHRLLMGPWAHGGSGKAKVGTSQQGELFYPGAEGWSDSIALVFFDYYLRGINNTFDAFPTVKYFQMGEDIWRDASSWPPPITQPVTFDLAPNNRLTLFPDIQGTSTLTYDPNDPSPTYGGATLRNDLKQGPYNQKDTVEDRSDILIFTSDSFDQDMVLIGKPVVTLYVSTDRLDTDFALRLTDVYPDGRSMLLSENIQRMRFRNGYTANDTSLLSKDTVYKIIIELPNIANTFLIGHKVRLDITSSNYPRYNRNMNTGGEMYPNGNGDTLVSPLIATSVVHYDEQLSNIVLPLEGFNIGIPDPIPFKIPNVQLYPNPASKTVALSFYNYQDQKILIDLLDIYGRTIRVLEHCYSPSGINSFLFSIEDLANGVYFIHLATQHKFYMNKLIIGN